MSNINWSDPKCQVTTHFNVKDCLWLPQWSRLANESDGLNDTIKENLINLCAKLEVVRHFLGDKGISVHCMYRPPLYNKLVKGASLSAHLTGNACDFHVLGYDGNTGCDKIRELLVPKLDEFDLRMEDVSDKDKRDWCHLDDVEPHPHRYFKP